MRVLLFLALIYPAMASATETGNELLANCDKPENYFADGVCFGYLQGVQDAHQTFQGWGDLNEPSYCMPDGVTVGQAQAIVVKYLKENPEDLHHRASGLVLNAFEEAFPGEVKLEDGKPVYYCP